MASAMRVAFDVLTKEAGTVPDAIIRKRAAVTMYGDIGSNRQRLIELFAWYAVFQPAVQQAVYNADTGAITPENLNDDTMDTLVKDFWGIASKIIDEAD